MFFIMVLFVVKVVIMDKIGYLLIIEVVCFGGMLMFFRFGLNLVCRFVIGLLFFLCRFLYFRFVFILCSVVNRLVWVGFRLMFGIKMFDFLVMIVV